MDLRLKRKKVIVPSNSMDWAEGLQEEVLDKYDLCIQYDIYYDSDKIEPLRYRYLQIVTKTQLLMHYPGQFFLSSWFCKEDCTLSEFMYNIVRHRNLFTIMGKSDFINDLTEDGWTLY